MVSTLQEAVQQGLSRLVGLQLSAVNYAGNVRLFHFGQLSPPPDRCGRYAIHVQCPWRLETQETILTGLAEWYIPANEEDTDDDWDPARGGSLQDSTLRTLMGDVDSPEGSIVNRTEQFLVSHVEADAYGGFRIGFKAGMGLTVFPTTNRGEQWRLFQPHSDARHLVVENGTVYYD